LQDVDTVACAILWIGWGPLYVATRIGMGDEYLLGEFINNPTTSRHTVRHSCLSLEV